MGTEHVVWQIVWYLATIIVFGLRADYFRLYCLYQQPALYRSEPRGDRSQYGAGGRGFDGSRVPKRDNGLAPSLRSVDSDEWCADPTNGKPLAPTLAEAG